MSILRRNNADISIHALREEGDCGRYQVRQRHFEFLSTPSARRATDAGHQIDVVVDISIHALREEGDENTLKTLAKR